MTDDGCIPLRHVEHPTNRQWESHGDDKQPVLTKLLPYRDICEDVKKRPQSCPFCGRATGPHQPAMVHLQYCDESPFATGYWFDKPMLDAYKSGGLVGFYKNTRDLIEQTRSP